MQLKIIPFFFGNCCDCRMEDSEQNGTPGKVGPAYLFTEQESGYLDESFMETCTNESLR